MDQKDINILLQELYNGTISEKNYRKLELMAVDDVFLFEALEGYALNKHQDSDLASIQKRIEQRISSDSKSLKKTWIWIAASFVGLCFIGSLLLQLLSNDPSSVADSHVTDVKKTMAILEDEVIEKEQVTDKYTETTQSTSVDRDVKQEKIQKPKPVIAKENKRKKTSTTQEDSGNYAPIDKKPDPVEKVLTETSPPPPPPPQAEEEVYLPAKNQRASTPETNKETLNEMEDAAILNDFKPQAKSKKKPASRSTVHDIIYQIKLPEDNTLNGFITVVNTESGEVLKFDDNNVMIPSSWNSKASFAYVNGYKVLNMSDNNNRVLDAIPTTVPQSIIFPRVGWRYFYAQTGFKLKPQAEIRLYFKEGKVFKITSNTPTDYNIWLDRFNAFEWTIIGDQKNQFVVLPNMQ